LWEAGDKISTKPVHERVFLVIGQRCINVERLATVLAVVELEGIHNSALGQASGGWVGLGSGH
jgi:hypothetical protein